VALQLATLICICIRSERITNLSVPSAALNLVAAIALVALSHLEHTRSIRSSFLIGLYLCITVLLRAATARTYWFLYGNGPIASTTLAAVLVQLVIIAFEECSKRKWLGAEHGGVSAEELAGFLSRTLFCWLAPLFLAGYRRAFTPSDIQPIDSSIGSSLSEGKFDRLQARQNCMIL